MNKKRYAKDFFMNALTWLASSVSAFVLFAIFLFIFRTGWSTLNWQIIRGDYFASNTNAAFEEGSPGAFEAPEGLEADAHFSHRYGFALRAYIDHQKERIMELSYVAPDSPLRKARITTAGPTKDQLKPLAVGDHLKKISYLNAEGKKRSAGILGGHDVEETIRVLDEESKGIVDYYAQGQGGGIRGSLITSVLLIVLTLLIALPLGIAAAVYLNELAPTNQLTAMIRSSVEMLAGVPSIIFGLMGMTMLYPVTRLFGIEGQSILLGALTLAVILLPVIIRQTEEALKVVPLGMRMASLSLGATSTQTIFKVVLPNALPGILTACLLSMSRIIGESAALIYTMGTAISDHPSIGKGATSLAVQIWSVMGGEQPNFELASAISIVILLMVLALNLLVKLVSYRIQKKWS